MRIGCWYLQKQLARIAVRREPIPPESLLGRHLEHCARCRTASAELAALVAALPARGSLPDVSASFTSAVLQGAEQRRRQTEARRRELQRRELRLVAAGLGAAAVVLGATLAFRNRSDAPAVAGKFAGGVAPAVPVPERIPTVPAHQPGSRRNAESRRVARGDGAVSAGTDRVRRRSGVQRLTTNRFRLRGRGRIGRRLAHAAPALPAPPHPPAAERDQWLASGLRHELQGQDWLASVEYGRAFEKKPEAGVALAAGRTAERAGEVLQALSYYERLLEPAGPAAETERPEE